MTLGNIITGILFEKDIEIIFKMAIFLTDGILYEIKTDKENLNKINFART